MSAAGVAAAAVWGLIRSARAEHPDRFALADDHGDGSVAVAAIASGATEVAVRDGRAYGSRLVVVTPAASTDVLVDQAGHPVPEFGDGAALVTGASGRLAGLAARHLVTAHGVRQLVLSAGPRRPRLAAELTGLGAEVTVAAVDVTDRDAVRAALADHRLRIVVHAAGMLDDGCSPR
ncbi:KR domain-containing protein [Micromonospora sp. M12]